MHSERLTWTLLPKASPLGYVPDWSSVPSGRTLSIEIVISWLLELDLPFYSLPTGAWFPVAPGSLNDGLSILLGTLYLTNRSSLDDWGPLTDGYSAPLTIHSIHSLAFFKIC